MHARIAPVALLLLLACQKDQPSGNATADTTSSAHPPPASASPATATAGTTASAAASAVASAPPPAASGSGAPAGAAAADPALLKIDGKAIQGGLLRAKIDGKVKHVGFPGHKTTILEDGEFLIAFARTAPAKEKLVLTLTDGSRLEREFDIEQRTYETDKIDNLPKKQVDLDAPTKKKVAENEKKLDELRNKFRDGTCFRETFRWPVKGKITSRYGQPRVLDGEEAGPHWGVDIAAVVGTPVHAPACGKVVALEKDVPLSGNLLVIDHGRGLTSTFLHLDKFKVKVGDEVKQGEPIATVGLTGRTNGAHLDWRMNLYDIRTDPELLAPPM